MALLAADNDPPQVSVNAHYPRGADRFNQGSQVRSLVITPKRFGAFPSYHPWAIRCVP